MAPLFYKTMILFNDVVEVFDLPQYAFLRKNLFVFWAVDRRWICRIFIEVNSLFAALLNERRSAPILLVD